MSITKNVCEIMLISLAHHNYVIVINHASSLLMKYKPEGARGQGLYFINKLLARFITVF